MPPAPSLPRRPAPVPPRRGRLHPGPLLAALLALAACGRPYVAPPEVYRPIGPSLQYLPVGAPAPREPSGHCWSHVVTPALIETVTEQLRDSRPGSGPASYRTVTRQAIIRERAAAWFPIPCPNQIDADYFASIQRALQARHKYRGPINGVMDQATADAIRALQKPLGLDSQVLSLSAAEDLGLVAVGRDL